MGTWDYPLSIYACVYIYIQVVGVYILRIPAQVYLCVYLHYIWTSVPLRFPVLLWGLLPLPYHGGTGSAP